jgi:hypothetical protein
MDNKRPRIIGILTSKLPYDLANLMYREFEDRFKEVNYFIENYSYFRRYRSDLRAIEILLAMAIFYRRVVANLDGAVQFRKTITDNSEAQIVRIGSYELDKGETNQLLSVIIGFKNIKLKYGISDFMFMFEDTKGFFRQVRDLKKSFYRRRN